MGRYRHRPLHLFGGVGLLMGAVGFIILLYLTVDGSGARHRDTPAPHARRAPVVVGIQFVSLGLLSELITSQHEERIDERERIDLFVEDVLR